MEYTNQNGKHIKVCCARCRGGVWVPLAEMKANPAPIICGDCQRISPALAETEFQSELRRSEDDSLAMRARWAVQDAEREGKAS